MVDGRTVLVCPSFDPLHRATTEMLHCLYWPLVNDNNVLALNSRFDKADKDKVTVDKATRRSQSSLEM